MRVLHESIFRHSPSFTAPAEKKGWIVSKANKTGQFSIITTTPCVIPAYRAPRNYKISWVISAGIQLAPRANLCYLALLRKFAFANWIPPFGGMTNMAAFPTPPLRRGRQDNVKHLSSRGRVNKTQNNKNKLHIRPGGKCSSPSVGKELSRHHII